MPGGYGNIKPSDGVQFSSTNQPANRGRKVGLKKSLRKLIDADGSFVIPMGQVDEIVPDTTDEDGKRIEGFVAIKIPTKELIVMNLVRIAMSGNASEATRAIELIMRHLDGNPAPADESDGRTEDNNEDLPEFTDYEALEEVKRLRASASIIELEDVHADGNGGDPS